MMAVLTILLSYPYLSKGKEAELPLTEDNASG